MDYLTQKLSPLISAISHLKLYSKINSLPRLRYFMEQHVFAVWDFMCLLKGLQQHIICSSPIWLPPKNALCAHLINSILAEEESDIDEEGNYASHFDIYLAAMRKIGANTYPIEKLLALLKKGISIEEALKQIPIRESTKQFVLTTFSFLNQSTHALAAAFVYGREGVTSAMFAPLIQQLTSKLKANKEQLSILLYYCNRHLELDNGKHFSKALQMLANFIDNDRNKLKEAETAAIQALNARMVLLTDIQTMLSKLPGKDSRALNYSNNLIKTRLILNPADIHF